MKNIKMTLQYDGTRYLGWQRPEKDGRNKTISFKISETLKRITGTGVTVYAGAKTEAHVHALGQIINFQTDFSASPEELASLLNQYLPGDIAVLRASYAEERFRADLNARSRTYEYHICTSPVYDVFTSAYTAHISPGPDIEAMEKGAVLLMGRHDFTPFCGKKPKKSAEKEIYDISFFVNDNISKETIISITAHDFLYQMPSLIIGTLLEIGMGKRKPECITDIFNGMEKAGAPSDPRGLLLKEIRYHS